MLESDPLVVAPSGKFLTYLGFDYGTRDMGVAVGQTRTMTATILETLRVTNYLVDWASIARLIDTWQPAALIVGIIYQDDGSDNPVTPHIRGFCRQLKSRTGLPVHQMDESFSTTEGRQRFFAEIGSRSSDYWKIKDQLAAQLILESWMVVHHGRQPHL